MSAMEHDPAEDLIECRTYTHARKFPLVIGQIGGYYLPVPWTPAQLVVAVGAFLLLLMTRRVWAHMGVAGNVAVIVGVPLLLSFLIRHLKIEGRSTARGLAGFGRYLARSRTGKLHGRPVARASTHWHPATRIFVTQTADIHRGPIPLLAEPVGAPPSPPRRP
jgi:TcpE family